MKNYIIKCYRCKARFEGNNLDDLIRANNLKPYGKLYYCECKAVDKVIQEKIAKPKKESKKSFWGEDDII